MTGFGLTRVARAMALALFLASPAAAANAGETTLYRGARVWTGRTFEARDLAVRDGRFVDPRKAGAGARVISVAERYVVPAYANAHTHLTQPSEAGSRRFTDVGVFYAWNPNTNVIPPEGKAFFARPDTFDVAVSQGGITEPGGHPEKLYTMIFPGRTVQSLVGDAFHYGETPAQIDAALDLLVSQRADFVKAYLIYSEDYAEKRGKKVAWGLRGINPANAPYLVKAAKKRGLKTVFHAETIADLVTAIDSGAAAIMHAPAYGPGFDEKTRGKWALTDATARRVARSGVLMVTTYGLIRGFDGTLKRGPIEEKQRAVQTENLRLLAKYRATILIGTDKDGEIFSEAEHLAGLNALAPGDLVRIVLGTGRHLFPDRRIGCFDTGCEADFLVLREDPLADIRKLRSIEMRIKAGKLLEPSLAE